MDNKNEPVQLAGKVKLNKDGEGKKFLKIFFTGTLKDAAKYAFNRVVVPYGKDVICKTANSVVNFWVNGDMPATNQREGVSRISYWNPSANSRLGTGYSAAPAAQPRVNNVYTVGTLYFDDRGDAETVLLRLKENLITYKVVSVADLYELSGEKFSFTDYKYGWRNLDAAYVARTMDGKYVIELPKIMPIE